MVTFLSNLISKFQKRNLVIDPIIIVSGLPRSGTSMMMKMLVVGGVEILTDHIRTANEDNPEGYFEYERVKQLRNGDLAWLADASGKGVKIISALLEYLPTNINFRIIFLEREIQEILASQKQMLIRREEPYNHIDNQIMAEELKTHLNQVKYWLARQSHMQVLYINYNHLMKDPESVVKMICEFLAIDLDEQAMLRIPNPSLYRQRQDEF